MKPNGKAKAKELLNELTRDGMKANLACGTKLRTAVLALMEDPEAAKQPELMTELYQVLERIERGLRRIRARLN